MPNIFAKSVCIPHRAGRTLFLCLLLSGLYFLPLSSLKAQVTTITTAGAGTYTVPAGVTSIKVEVWGGGGRGGSRTTNGYGGGGGGGAYSQSVITVIPEQNINYNVGAGSSSGTLSGGDSWFVTNATIMAKGGGSVADNTTSGASGGQAANGVGTVKYSGGNGANAGTYGGGGGSSAGTAANGNSTTSSAGGAAPTGGGAGGAGRTGTQGGGTGGNSPGGGGGGAYRNGANQSGGNGAPGQIRITAQSSLQTSGGSYSFIIPIGIASIYVEAWGGGGGGASRTSGSYGNGGGGGGAYASSVLTVIPGTSYSYTVGAGGAANTTGGNSSFSTNQIIALGGTGATSNSRIGGAGGNGPSSTGNVKFSGGSGGTAVNTYGTYSGSGGGGAGSSGNGGNGSASSTGGVGGTGNANGTGGAGRNTNGTGNTGVAYGGGGSGAYRTSGSQAGGAGADGAVKITLILPEITGSVYLRSGETSQLANAVAGGTWSSANTAIATVSSTGIVTAGTTSGTVDITYSIGELSRVKTIHVIPFNKNIIDVCAGATINLNASSSSSPDDWVWIGPNNYFSTTPNSSIPSASSSMEGVYYGGNNLLINGNFEGSYTGNVFSSDYILGDGSASALQPEGRYQIGNTPKNYHSSFSSCGDHTTSIGNQMIVNGATTTPPPLLWSQTVSVSQNTNYVFSYWIQTVVVSNEAKLQFKIDGVNAGSEFTAPTTAACGNWTQFTHTWNSGAKTSVVLSLYNTNTVAGGNDFALDDIVLYSLDFQDTVYVRVANSFTPVVKIVSNLYGVDPVPAGVNVTYTAYPQAGVGAVTPTYVWKVNGQTISGSIGATLNYTPKFGDQVSCTMTTSLSCASPASANSNIITTSANYWNGTSYSAVWDVASNWTANVVPSPGGDVVFATVANYGADALNDLHVPTGIANAKTVGNLTNASTRNLIIPADAHLTVTGVVSIKDPNTGTNSTEASKIQIKAGTNIPNGTFVMNCATQLDSSQPDIYATIDLYARGYKGEVQNWQDNIVGSPTNGQTFSTSYHWQYFGVPVASIVAQPTFNGAALREYFENYNGDNNSTYFKKWKDLVNESTLSAFKGYEITQNSATYYSIAGKLVYCDKNLTMTRQAPKVGNTEAGNEYYGLGQNLFGNSFTAAIKVNEITFPAEAEEVVYLYNTGRFTDWGNANSTNNGSGLTAGQYTAIPKNASPAVYDGQIPSMNGFLVKFLREHTVPSADNKTLTVKYNGGGVTPNTKPQTTPPAPLSYLQIGLRSQSTMDNLWLLSQAGTTTNFDNGWDGRKYFGTPSAFIYTETAAGPMQVAASETIDGTVINFYANQDKEYRLLLVKHNLDKYNELHLIDLQNRVSLPLVSDTTIYNFTSEVAGLASSRFLLVNSSGFELGGGDELKLLNAQLTGSGKLLLTNYTGNKGVMALYDTSGRELLRDKLPVALSEHDVRLLPGVYLLRMQAGNIQKTVKLLLSNGDNTSTYSN